MTLTQELEGLITVVELQGIRLRTSLRPGLPYTAIKKSVEALSLYPPPDLYEMYMWHNGLDILNPPLLVFGEYNFISLEEGIYEYHELQKYYADTILPLQHCLPFARFDASYLALYCEETVFYGLQYPIIEIAGDISFAFENVRTMIQTVTSWYNQGVYTTGFVDEKLKQVILQRFNPRLPNLDTTL